MKTIFITGASSGIGRETAKYFSAHGWRVIATMRNTQKAGDLDALPEVIIMPLDLTNPTQIEATCQAALKEYDIDVLFNNAGYGMMGPFEKLPAEEIRKLFDTDVIGTMLVTQQFIPHFKRRRAGIILTTTSLAGIIALPRDGAYGAAKRAQQGMVESLYYELRPFGVKMAAMIPGGTNTNFQTPINILDGYENAAAKQRAYLLDGNKEFPGPEEAAEAVWEAVHDGKDQINYPTDSVCRKLYQQYVATNIEDFKGYLFHKLFQ